MTVEVCTIWAPRPSHPKWSDDYLDLIDLQRETALRWGAEHMVITDDHGFMLNADPALGAYVRYTGLPQSLMRAMIAGVVHRLAVGGDRDLLFVDIDVLIGRDPRAAFDGSFDLGLTRRANADGVYINNGAMYVAAAGIERSLGFFSRALARCGDHWGADQEAITAVAMPVPLIEQVEQRGELRLAFLSMKTHNCVPKAEGQPHMSDPFAIHFKGPTKAWARTYAEKFIFATA